MNKRDLLEHLSELEDEIISYASNLWESPEVAGMEQGSAALSGQVLARHGFTIREVPGMDNAMIAEFGQGAPVIALLGEYDALPGLSQTVCAHKAPVEAGKPGHGCGHNLLGGAALGAALALKEYLIQHGLPGTVRFYGCPEEESLSGKVKMLKAGVFSDCDVALSWHPLTRNEPQREAFLANNSIKFRFHGRTAHAALSPTEGRSALDAVELMNVGANYLREHIPDSARMHYTITETGGAPNIIPDLAESWYYVRAPRRRDVEEITARLTRVAEGAAMMTETTVETEFVCGTYELLPNQVLFDLTRENMKETPLPVYTDDELEFARDLYRSLPGREEAAGAEGWEDTVLSRTLTEPDPYQPMSLYGSSEVGDVSWNIPASLFVTATWPVGTPPHTWQATAASGSNLGYKAMMYAAGVMSGIGYDILNDPSLAEKAKEELKERTKDKPYVNTLDNLELEK